MLIIMNIIAVISSLVGVLLLAHKVKWGFAIYFVTEISMAYIGWATHQYGLIIMSCVYFSANVYAYTKWHKEEQKSMRRNTW